jgi:hypothetical protein
MTELRRETGPEVFFDERNFINLISLLFMGLCIFAISS